MIDARAAIVGILVTAAERLTATELIALARPLGLTATNVKSHLTRMVDEGSLLRAGAPRQAVYWPGIAQRRVIDGITARLRAEAAPMWDRSWLLVTLQLPRHRPSRDAIVDALWFDGFRRAGPATFLRPAWPRSWAEQRAREHLSHTPGIAVRGAIVGTLELNGVRRLYKLDALDRDARRLARRIARLPVPASPARAFAIRLKVGGWIATFIGHDPRLPPALWGSKSGIRDLVRTFRAFEARVVPVAQRFVDDVLAARRVA